MGQSVFPPRRRLTQKFFCYSGTGSTPTAGVTRYLFLRGGLDAQQFAEVQAQTVFRQRGRLRNLRVYVTAGLATAVIILRINGVDQTLTVTVPNAGGSQLLTDLVNEDLVVPNDLVNWRITTGAAGSPTLWRIEVDFIPEVPGAVEVLPPRTAPQVLSAINPNLSMTAGATTWLPVDAYMDVATVEARAQLKVPTDGFIRNARIYGTPGANDATFTLRVNGVNTALVITMPGGGGVGDYTDLVNAVRVNEGNLINWQVVCGAGAPTGCRILQCQLFPDIGEDSQEHGMFYPQRTVPQQFAAVRVTGTGAWVGLRYAALEGRWSSSPLEIQSELTMQHGGIFINLRIYALPDAADSVAVVRVNGVDTALTVTLTGGAAEGLFTDLINTVEVDEGDVVTIGITSGGVGILIYFNQLDFIPRIP